jgi:hypothetical protein
MRLISHRGNLNGPNPDQENRPSYIDEAILRGFDVEVDVWVVESEIVLGHDFPQYYVSIEWLRDRSESLWIHCKNIEAITYFSKYDAIFGTSRVYLNFFWHETDRVTLTSKGAIWAYPGNQPISGSIAVMPELFNDDLSDCFGICSDYVANYR